MQIFSGSRSIGLKLSKTCPIIALGRLENFLRLFEIQSDQKIKIYIEVELSKNDPKTAFFGKIFDMKSSRESGDRFEISNCLERSRQIYFCTHTINI